MTCAFVRCLLADLRFSVGSDIVGPPLESLHDIDRLTKQ